MSSLMLKQKRESMASAYRKTTKFLTNNTNSLLKIIPNPNNRKYRFLAQVIEEYEPPEENETQTPLDENSIDSDFGERDLDYYLGVKNKETCWRDRTGKEQIEKDYFIFHCGVTEDDYDTFYKKTSSDKATYTIQPRLKQVPFRIHRKKSNKDESWAEKTRFFKLFANRRDSSSTSDSYSECDSNSVDSDNRLGATLSERYTYDNDFEGVRINEVSEGRPCDHCPELCPGFIPHPWRKTCKSCGCDRLTHGVYHEELSSVRERLGLRETRPNHHGLDSPPGLTAKQTELYWASLAERAPSIPGATGAAAWKAWRTRALAKQLPKQDLSLAHCKNVKEEHQKQYEDFIAARNEIALDIGFASQHHGPPLECIGCNKKIPSGSIVILAPRLGDEAYFHPACFTCVECDDLLVELAHCVFEGRLYCARHYADRLKPRCHACDEDPNYRTPLY